jgi:hypothetical protein
VVVRQDYIPVRTLTDPHGEVPGLRSAKLATGEALNRVDDDTFVTPKRLSAASGNGSAIQEAAMFDPETLPFWQSRWGWHYDPDATIRGPAYRRQGATVKSRGSIEIYVPGATYEQMREIEDGLIERFDPAYLVPGTRFIRKLGSRPGGHNSELAG